MTTSKPAPHGMTDTTEATNPPHVLNPETFSRFLVRDFREIHQIVNALIEKRALLTVHINGNTHFVSIVLAISPDGKSLILDASPDDAINSRASGTSNLICDTRLDSIRVQFAVTKVEQITHDTYRALRVSMPDGILRLQRREFFRLPTPQSDPLICTVTTGSGDATKKTVSVRILDISGGGLAVVVPPEGIDFSPGMEFPDCSLKLPEGPVAIRLKVRNLFNVDMLNNVRVLRAGCEFVDLPSGVMNRLQRYIFKIERERNARGSVS